MGVYVEGITPETCMFAMFDKRRRGAEPAAEPEAATPAALPPLPSLRPTEDAGGRPDLGHLHEQVAREAAWVQEVRDEIGQVVVGQRELVDRLLIGLLTGGHLLLEGLPGLAKTLTVNTLARTLDARFSRIQFTPDMLPADIVGTLIYEPQHGFRTRPGPVFANLVLADEINRAPAKVQSALLEAMQERQVTLGDETRALPRPFLVMATQNPVDQEGTYTLPEAQMDRFLLKVVLDYPTPDEERRILDAMATSRPDTTAHQVVTLDRVLDAREVVDALYIDDKVKDYIVHLVLATRDPAGYGMSDLEPMIRFGGSPRATIALTLAARAHAFLDGRAWVTPRDVKALAPDVLRHRVATTWEAEARGIDSEQIVARILDTLPVP